MAKREREHAVKERRERKREKKAEAAAARAAAKAPTFGEIGDGVAAPPAVTEQPPATA
jgi:hypothetical protein